MSKRRYFESDDDAEVYNVNPVPKRIRQSDGTSSAVHPLRYEHNYKDVSLDSDEEGDAKEKDLNSMETDDGLDIESLGNGPSFDTLLYQLASMNVSTREEEDSSVETCPICVERVSLSEFPSHVYGCLDRMEDGDRNDLRSQVDRDQDMAISLIERQPYNYSEDMSTYCPICNKELRVGESMNVHANDCIDQQEADEASTAMGKFSIESNTGDDIRMETDELSGTKAMTNDQMSACANALLLNQKGSREYDSMLSMFQTLGFNERNIRRAVQKKQEEKAGQEPPPPSPFEEPSTSDMAMDGPFSSSTGFSPGMFSNPAPIGTTNVPPSNSSRLDDLGDISDSDI